MDHFDIDGARSVSDSMHPTTVNRPGAPRYILPPHAGRLHRLFRRIRNRLAPRARLHLYCVGAPKSGTHSIAAIFAERYRAEHEPFWWQLVPCLNALAQNHPDACNQAQRLIRRRRIELDLDLESAHILGPLVPFLARTFADARFILPVRHPRQWLDSLIEDQIYGQSEPLYKGWWRVYDCYFGDRSTASWPAEEAPLRDQGLYPLRSMLTYWRDHHLRILDSVPTERLLILPTEAISESRELLAAFAGVPASDLHMAASHSYARKRRTHLLDRIPAAYVDNLIADLLGDLPRRLRGHEPLA